MKTLVHELFQFNLLTLLTSIALIAVFSAQVTGDLGEPLDLKNDRYLQAYLRRARNVARIDFYRAPYLHSDDSLFQTEVVHIR